MALNVVVSRYLSSSSKSGFANRWSKARPKNNLVLNKDKSEYLSSSSNWAWDLILRDQAQVFRVGKVLVLRKDI